MRKFDPWLVFFKREWERNWPFLVGFAVTGTVITKFSLGLTEEDAKNSKFVQAHKSKDVKTEREWAQPIKRFSNAVLFSSMLSLVSLTSLYRYLDMIDV